MTSPAFDPPPVTMRDVHADMTQTVRELSDEIERRLRFTPKEQNVLAELCSICRSLKYEMDTRFAQPGYSAQQIDTRLQEAGEQLMDLLDRFEVSPQMYDDLYDRFHRAGVNR